MIIVFGFVAYILIAYTIYFSISDDRPVWGRYALIGVLQPKTMINLAGIVEFPVSRERLKKVYGKSFSILFYSGLIFYAFYSILLFLLFSIGMDVDLKGPGDCFLFPLGMLVPLNFFAIPIVPLSILGKRNNVSLHRCRLEFGALSYFYICGYKNTKYNTIYYFNKDVFESIERIEEGERVYILHGSIRRDTYRVQNTYLSLDNLVQTGEDFYLQEEKLVIPKVFDGLDEFLKDLA